MKKVIISGASGYFGSLTKYYLEKLGYSVFSAGRSEHSDFSFDLDSPLDFADTKFDGGIDFFIHAAATHEVDCVNFPYKCISRNVAGTRAALDFCVKNNIKKFIYVSTFHVYGTDKGVVSEKTATKPSHDYGLTHLQAEEYVRMYTQKGLIDGVSIRPSNMFDPPISFDSFNRWPLIPFNFCKSAIEKGCIELKSSGYQQRNFISVKDIVTVILKLSKNDLSSEIINIPGVSTYSIREFAYLVKDLLMKNFDKTVEVFVPDGEDSTKQLIYKSDVFNPVDFNFSGIENHIVNFSKKLIENA